MNPYLLQTIELMNLIINSTATTEDNKKIAETVLNRLLVDLDKTTLEISANSLGLVV